ncbi:hypothetical protein KEM48_005535, partial [Puccinia striiformis f. sp. tritici PST-130]
MEDHTGPSGNPSTEASASLIEETCVSPRPMIPHRRPTSARPAEVQPARCNVGAVTPNCHTLIQALSWAMDDKTRQVIVPQHRLGLYELCVAGPMQHQAGRMHDTAATARRHMMTRPAAPNTSPSDDGEVACAGVWSTGNEDPSARALRSSSPMWLSLPRGSDELGNTGFSASPPEPSISETLSEQQAIHDIAQHIGTEPSTGTVAEGITGGEVGRTFEDHTNPIDDKWVTAQKAKGEQHVDLQQLIAKIPQLRDISTIQARN